MCNTLSIARKEHGHNSIICSNIGVVGDRAGRRRVSCQEGGGAAREQRVRVCQAARQHEAGARADENDGSTMTD